MTLGITLGVIHALAIGIPFIQAKGGGEGLAYLLLFVDFPLVVIAEVAFQRLLLNSVNFNFAWFVGGGTLMYFAVGYGIGLLVDRRRRRPAPGNPNASTSRR